MYLRWQVDKTENRQQGSSILTDIRPAKILIHRVLKANDAMGSMDRGGRGASKQSMDLMLDEVQEAYRMV
jgi:hypothetical protein